MQNYELFESEVRDRQAQLRRSWRTARAVAPHVAGGGASRTRLAHGMATLLHGLADRLEGHTRLAV